jgi:ubiquitin carboxyl-terminal hydrolase 34
MVDGGEDLGTRISVESESDALSTIPAIETPSSSPSPMGSPTVELVVQSEDDSDFGGQDPPVAIIDDDSDSVYLDPLASFPYWAEGETLINTLVRVARFLQYGVYGQLLL